MLFGPRRIFFCCSSLSDHRKKQTNKQTHGCIASLMLIHMHEHKTIGKLALLVIGKNSYFMRKQKCCFKKKIIDKIKTDWVQYSRRFNKRGIISRSVVHLH